MSKSKQNDAAADRLITSAENMLKTGKMTSVQKRWLQKGLKQPGGKLPLFDDNGREIAARTIRACIDAGWAEPWFSNPIKPDWLVCKLTPAAFDALAASQKKEES
ncbi:MAG: hypothetical protein ABJL55_08125 [Roseibium sp.]